MLVDTHAHLQWARFDKDRENVISRAKKVGVEHIVNIGFDINSSREAIKLTEKHKGLYATVGVHPHDARKMNQFSLDELRRLAGKPKVVAIGEIGLDYYRNLSPRETQKKAFEAQLSLAEELKLPVVVHNREAQVETLGILSKFDGRINGIMHCFSGNMEMAEWCVRSSFYMSFAGPVTYPSSHKLRGIARWADLNKVLLETDSPWLTPQNKRGRRNEPAFLPFIAKKVAELKGISADELAEATTENAKEVFQLP